jgi:hypothetical protein
MSLLVVAFALLGGREALAETNRPSEGTSKESAADGTPEGAEEQPPDVEKL